MVTGSLTWTLALGDAGRFTGGRGDGPSTGAPSPEIRGEDRWEVCTCSTGEGCPLPRAWSAMTLRAITAAATEARATTVKAWRRDTAAWSGGHGEGGAPPGTAGSETRVSPNEP